MMYSVTDVSGLNWISRTVLAQRREGVHRHGRRARRGEPTSGPSPQPRRASASPCSASPRPPCSRSRRLERRLRVPRLPRYRRRRPLDGEADRFRHARRRHRPHNHRGRRHADGRRIAGGRGPFRRRHPHPHALCRFGRRARHGQFRRRPRPSPQPTSAGSCTSTIRR